MIQLFYKRISLVIHCEKFRMVFVGWGSFVCMSTEIICFEKNSRFVRQNSVFVAA